MIDDIVIDVENVYKTFRIYHEKRNSIYDQISSTFNRKKHYEDFPVLQDISFQVKKGEMFGIVGLNGSGKTTLLRLLAGIMKPNSGKIETRGKMVPLIALGTGFNAELTAYDNIIMNGMILGFTKKEITKKVDSIIKFAELEKFVDTKLKNFSTGMNARLAFSIAMQVDPDILIVDEVLSVGDVPFQEKSFNAFMSFRKRNKSIVFVTHSVPQISRLCDKAVFLHQGRIHTIGKPNEVVNAFYRVVEKKKVTGSGELISITRHNEPVSIGINQETNMIYVANIIGDSITVIDGYTNKIIKNIQINSAPRDLCVNEKLNQIYVANRDTNSVSIIDGKTNEIMTNIVVGERPRGICIDTMNNKIYVANRDSNNVTVIDLLSNKVISNIESMNGPTSLVISPKSEKLYLANTNESTIVIVDTKLNKFKKISVGNGPTGITLNPISNKVYVANNGSDSISVISTIDERLIDTVSVGNGPFGISVNDKTNQVYVTNSGHNSLSKIDGNTNKLLKTLAVGNYPLGIAINKITNKIYVANQASDSVSIIDGSSDLLVSDINLVS